MKKRRIISFVLASMLIFSMTAAALPPSEQTDMAEARCRSDVVTPIISRSLSFSFKNAIVADESTWIPLYNTKIKDYAYFVPLCDEQGTVTGFSVVRNADGNHNTLHARHGGGLDEFAMLIMETYQNRAPDEKMIYTFPYGYIIGDGNSYRRIYMDGTLENISPRDAYRFYRILPQNYLQYINQVSHMLYLFLNICTSFK